LSLDTDNPAFEAATKNTIEAVKKTDVEVVESSNDANSLHSYEVTQIKLIEDSTAASMDEQPV
jgi:hypothetical protein